MVLFFMFTFLPRRMVIWMKGNQFCWPCFSSEGFFKTAAHFSDCSFADPFARNNFSCTQTMPLRLGVRRPGRNSVFRIAVLIILMVREQLGISTCSAVLCMRSIYKYNSSIAEQVVCHMRVHCIYLNVQFRRIEAVCGSVSYRIALFSDYQYS